MTKSSNLRLQKRADQKKIHIEAYEELKEERRQENIKNMNKLVKAQNLFLLDNMKETQKEKKATEGFLQKFKKKISKKSK